MVDSPPQQSPNPPDLSIIIVNWNVRDLLRACLRSVVRGQGLEKDQPPTPNPQPLIPVTYVPARNTIFLSFALAWAETLEAEHIFIGANAVDYSGYPDCRPEFIQAFEDMANLATKISVEGKVKFKIRAPLIKLTKAEIVRQGTELGVDYALTWSCYDPQGVRGQGSGVSKEEPIPNPQSPTPCMKCDSCMLRAKGFKEAGIKDPLLVD